MPKMPKSMTAAMALIATACLPMLPGAATAGGLKRPPQGLQLARSAAHTPTVKPPTGYQGQWWVHPAGCQYSRAGRPGEVVWFLNSIPRGVSCPEFIMQTPIDNSYRAPHMVDG